MNIQLFQYSLKQASAISVVLLVKRTEEYITLLDVIYIDYVRMLVPGVA